MRPLALVLALALPIVGAGVAWLLMAAAEWRRERRLARLAQLRERIRSTPVPPRPPVHTTKPPTRA